MYINGFQLRCGSFISAACLMSIGGNGQYPASVAGINGI
jgi:hypothetical protein